MENNLKIQMILKVTDKVAISFNRIFDECRRLINDLSDLDGVIGLETIVITIDKSSS
jgi:hypothetical protein